MIHAFCALLCVCTRVRMRVRGNDAVKISIGAELLFGEITFRQMRYEMSSLVRPIRTKGHKKTLTHTHEDTHVAC